MIVPWHLATRCLGPVVLCAVVFSGASVGAQTIPVNSGEHPGFSRLVLDIGAARDWEIAQSGSDVRIAFDPAPAGFDLSRVFDLIPRTRLADLRPEDGLRLTLACPCPVTATRFENRYLVLDIADAPSDPAQAPAQTAAGADTRDPAAARRLAAAESLPDLTTLLTRPDVAADPPAAALHAPADDPGRPEDGAATAPASLEQAAQIMAEQLARAAASGLLEAAPGRPLSDADPGGRAHRPDPPPATARPPADDVAPAPTGAMDPPEAPVTRLPIRAETAVDAALHRAVGAEPQRNRLACAGRGPDLAEWSGGAGVDRGLGRLRQGLYDERDRLRRPGVLALARHYLYYGFGAEAAFWLDRLDAPPADLLVIAALVDGVPDRPHFSAVSDPLTCSEEEFLWRYLDGATADALTEEQSDRLQLATAALPPVLRDQLAPRVAPLLARDGFPLAARNLRDTLVRGGRVAEAEILQLDLDLGIAPADDPEGTRLALAEALRDDGGDPVTVMAHALAFDRDTGIAITPTRLIAAEALLREHGVGPRTARLWQEVVLAHADRGNVHDVLALLAAPEIPPDRQAAALTALFVDRVAAEDTATLFILARLYGSTWAADGSVAGRARVSAIARLREAGLTGAAEMLRGGQRMLILPARPGIGPVQQDALQTAWQGAEWRQLAALDDGAHGRVALRMQQRADDPDLAAPATGDLSRIAARVRDSRRLREEITAILSDPVPGSQAGAE